MCANRMERDGRMQRDIAQRFNRAPARRRSAEPSPDTGLEGR
jgi:hypothetical protein